jgi:uncharacterized protein (DUF1800 family)
MVMSSPPLANSLFDQAPRTSTGLEGFRGTWNTVTAAHLLRRTTFGPTRAEIAAAAANMLDDIVGTLLQETKTPDTPVDPTTNQDWISKPFESTNDSRFQGYLRAWWMGLMATAGPSIREQMVLFWHNHFVSEYLTVPDSRLLYTQNALFRRYALGNIRELVKAVSIDPAMLIYLNGYRNSGNGSNIADENYGREMQELFTIGKGPQVGPGDYTNYTEQDVKAAARVLTGWRVTGYRDAQNAAIASYFNANAHDTKDKQFSAAYQNTVIKGSTDGVRELADLIDLIFRQEETARYLCRKLYRWFVYYDIDSAAERNVIVPLASVMRDNNYELKPVLYALLRSAHFFDPANIGCKIKNPVDMIAGSLRSLEITIPPADTQAVNYYGLMSSLAGTSGNLQMILMDPPNVAGWPAYYQVPEFHRLWINTITLPTRWAYTDSLLNGIRAGTARPAIDPLALAKGTPDPGDPQVLVSGLASLLFSVDLTANQTEYLIRSVLIPGLPDYEWMNYWAAYAADPNNAQTRNLVATKVTALLKFMLRMAEFQLA